MNRKAFYDTIRQQVGALSQDNVDGFERYLDEGWRRDTALDRLAYILATVYWETGRTMQPVEEAFYLGSRAVGYRKKLRYYPWHGRGDIQLTWEDNYRRAGRAIGVDLIADPDAAMDPKNSVKIAFEGMEGGWFTGKALGDYLDGADEGDKEQLREYANARRIVNGTDKQIEIAKLALGFEKALRTAGYGSGASAPPIVIPSPAPVPSPAPADPAPAPAPDASVVARYAKAIAAVIGSLVTLAVAKGVIPEGTVPDEMVTAISMALGAAIGPILGPKNAT